MLPAYSPIVERPRIAWPGGARLALWVVPNIEHYQFMPAAVPVQDPWPRVPHPDVGAYGLRDYGNRVGFWRMMPLLKRFGIPLTLSLNVAVYELFPAIQEYCEAEGYDVMCHGRYNTDRLFMLDPAGQREYIRGCQARFEALTGRRFVGWFSPANTATLATPDAAADCGLDYIVDFFNDDQPTLLAGGRIVSLPYTMDLNDGWNFRYAVEAEDFARATLDQFERLYQEGDAHPRVMSLPLHPYVFGQPHRIAALERLLDVILSREGVWVASGRDIAAWARQIPPAAA